MRRPSYPYRAGWKRAIALTFDTLGDIPLGKKSRPGRVPPAGDVLGQGLDGGAVKRVLVIRLDHVGDVLFSTVVFRPLRRLYPKAHITALTGPWAASLLLHHPDVDRVVSFRSPWFDRGGTSGWTDTLGILQFLPSKSL